ncbi:MAG: phytanoyl-CoA dioxygenase family protein [Lentisphaeria bacterium]|nr:phytanoyl-CoA dioxygenase family protein [Lentisphaeria bacterium]
MKLTAKQYDQYWADGYLLPSAPLFSEEKFSRLKAIFEGLVATHDPTQRTDTLDVPHFQNEELFEFLMAPEVLDVVESIIGPDFGLWSSHFISKEPKIGRATPWHEDSAYWNGRFENFDGIITIWLAIDPSTEENGCMKVIPGSHLTENSEYEAVDENTNTFDKEATNVDESMQVYFELQPNQYSLHDSRILHGAEANTSEHRRCGYTMRYFSQNMKMIPENNLGHKIWHCRGKNPHNNPVE